MGTLYPHAAWLDKLRLVLARLLLSQTNYLPIYRQLRNRSLSALLGTINLKAGARVALDCSHYGMGPYITLGTDVELGGGSILDLSGGLEIQSGVTISENAILQSHNHTVRDATKHWRDQELVPLPLVLEEECWVGAGAIILGRAGTVGRGAIVGAGSLVTRRVDPYSIVVGNPAQAIGRREVDETSSSGHKPA